jgi:hypothetical protein
MLVVIVTILLGNVVIGILLKPAFQKLRDLITRFSAIELPYRPLLQVGKQMTAEQRREAAELARREFSRLFREYVISFNAFKKVGGVFVGSVIILACAVAWNLPWGTRARILAMSVCVVAIALALAYLQRIFAPTPGQLISIDFLQNNFSNLHLDALFDCSRSRIDYGRPLGSGDPVMHFSLFQEMMFLDYKLLIAVTNAECSRIHFVAYGPIDSDTDFNQYWTPQLAHFSAKLGDFSYSDALLSSKLLHLHLWLFIPTPKGWVKKQADSPRSLDDALTVQMGGNIGSPLISDSCSWNSIDLRVEFEKKSYCGFSSWKILLVDVPTDNSPQAIVRMYKEKVERSKSIESADYPDGIGIHKTYGV